MPVVRCSGKQFSVSYQQRPKKRKGRTMEVIKETKRETVYPYVPKLKELYRGAGSPGGSSFATPPSWARA